MIKIHNRFTGGNIRVLSIEGDHVYLENEQRDSLCGWFYWAFCVEGAAGKELCFHITPNWLGYFGPAVSHDLESWHWHGQVADNTFTYRFGEGEDKVYFAHDMLYHPARFFAFAKERNLTVDTLCIGHKGEREVPCLHIGEGKTSILLAARAHCCEAPGSYVLEGVLDELLAHPIPDSRILCVPFIDYDGAIDGDQGKERGPHDHNRDYGPEIYPEVRAIRAYANQFGVHYAFDFHAPGHKGGESDTVYIVRSSDEKGEAINRFAALFESEITEDAMPFSQANTLPYNQGWNLPSANFGHTMMARPECKLAFTLENTYFGTPDNPVSPTRLYETGRAFARALARFIAESR